MRTLEVLDKVLRGKRLTNKTKDNYRSALGSLAKYVEDWPSDAVTINEWLNQIEGLADTTVYMYFRFVRSAGRYIEKISGKNQYGAYNVPNPTNDAERPKVAHREMSYRTPEEMMACIKVCTYVPMNHRLSKKYAQCKQKFELGIWGHDLNKVKGVYLTMWSEARQLGMV